MEQIWQIIAPHVLEIIAVGLSATIASAAQYAKRKWGLDIEARHRAALHQALLTGIKMAMARNIDTGKAVDLAIGYARLSVPDAIKALRPTEGVLATIARSKITE
jgi:hypothetical protein